MLLNYILACVVQIFTGWNWTYCHRPQLHKLFKCKIVSLFLIFPQPFCNFLFFILRERLKKNYSKPPSVCSGRFNTPFLYYLYQFKILLLFKRLVLRTVVSLGQKSEENQDFLFPLQIILNSDVIPIRSWNVSIISIYLLFCNLPSMEHVHLPLLTHTTS